MICNNHYNTLINNDSQLFFQIFLFFFKFSLIFLDFTQITHKKRQISCETYRFVRKILGNDI